MSKRGQEYNGIIKNQKERKLQDEKMITEANVQFQKNGGVIERYTKFQTSKIDDNKLKKMVQNKYDIIISEDSALILAILGTHFCKS